MNNDPLVSICCLTYNHVKFIKSCLDGFVQQKTDFKFEILIHDDASSDGTADIIRQYEKQYPDLFSVIYQSENQHSKTNRLNIRFNFSRARGKYIALCEGDDYWIDEYKLQRQIDFLKNNNDCQLCFHNAVYLKDGREAYDFVQKYPWLAVRTEFGLKDILKFNWFIPTASVVFRNNIDFPGWIFKLKTGDLPLHFICARLGKLVFMDFKGSVYRIHSQSVSNNSERNKLKFKRNAREAWFFLIASPLTLKYFPLRKYLSNSFRHYLSKFKTVNKQTTQIE